jgi:phosphatidylglycerophosphate synthase
VVAKYQPGGPTDFGHLLDSVLDYVFYSGVVFFFALGQPSTALTAAFLIFSITSNGISFLVLSAISEKRGPSPQTLPTHQKKNLRYSGGLPEGFETILLFISMCLLPNGFVPMAIIFSLFCWVTIVMRLSKARFQLAAKPSETAS